MNTLLPDLRYALRSLARTPRLTSAAIACAAVGIGSAVFILALVEAILVRQAPFPDVERLVRIWLAPEREATGRGDLSYLDFTDIRAQATSFDALELTARTRGAMLTADGAERIRGESVSAGYFDLIAARPALGRLFTSDEYAPDAPPMILLSDALWRRKLAASQDAIGQTVTMRGALAQESDRAYTVVGVMPPSFSGTIDEDVSEFWLPIEQYTPRVLLERRTTHMIWALGRLRPGATLASAQSELAGITQRLAAAYPDAYRERVLRVEPVGEISRERFRAGLLMLSGAAAMLLLIAYANVANLLLARHARRAGELAMRRVLGAGRWRILRQLLLESVLLAGAGGVLGAALAFVGVRVFVARDVLQMPDYLPIEPDLRIFGGALLLVLVTSVLFGVAPAWLGARRSAAQRLADARLRGGSAGRRERAFGDLLQSVEVALAFLLLLGSALMLRTYTNLLSSDVGFRTDHLLRMAVSLDPAQYPDAESRLAFAREARAQLEAQPGVRRASIMASVLPPWFDTEVRIAAGGEEREEIAEVPLHGIDTAFLEVLDIPLLRGRAFGDADRAGAPRVALVSESLARALAPSLGGDALGRSIQTITRDGTLSAPVEVVGVVADVRYNGPLAEPRAAGFTDLYLPLEQIPDDVLSIALWTDTDPAALVDSLQRVLGGIAPTSPQHWISTMEQELALQYSEARVQAWLTGVFGGAALVLVVLGLYGVLTHTVTRRFHELAVRQAVGARGRDIVAMVLGEGSRTMLLGLAAGAAVALAGARLLGTLLYGVAPNDPATFLVVAVALYGLGLAACALPARRAARVSPIEALRG